MTAKQEIEIRYIIELIDEERDWITRQREEGGGGAGSFSHKILIPTS